MSQGEDYYEREAAFSANNTFTANALTLPNSSEVGDIDARFRKVEEKYRVEFVEVGSSSFSCALRHNVYQ